MVELFSHDAWLTKKTEMPWSASAEKMRLLTPMMPTIPRPLTVARQVSLMEEMPLMTFVLLRGWL